MAHYLALFVMNINILLANLSKPEKSNILTNPNCDFSNDLQVKVCALFEKFTIESSLNWEISPVVLLGSAEK